MDTTMTLPVKEMPARKADSAILKRNILIIEDDVDTAETLAEFLKDEGYGCRYVCSRDDAVLALQRFLYDVVIMDYSMPGLSADSFVALARGRCPRSKFILTTAMGKVTECADSLGIHSWIGKPFRPEALLEVIRKCH